MRRKQDAKCFNGEDLERVISRTPCACSDLDFECDSGFERALQAGAQCRDSLESDERDLLNAELKEQSCSENDFYEVSKGYRKVPGDICVGGIDLSPTKYHCKTGGLFFGTIFNLPNFTKAAFVAALVYFGWPFLQSIEGIPSSASLA